MGWRDFWRSDAVGILEDATTTYRSSRDRAVHKGNNWDVDIQYKRASKSLEVKFSAVGDTATSLGRSGQARNFEICANGKTVARQTKVSSWLDFFVYHGINFTVDVSELGDIDDISAIKVYMLS